MLVEYGLVVATHGDLSEADADFSAVAAIYQDRGASNSFDAVTIAKKTTGEARFGRRHQQVGAVIDDQSVGWSLAGGLAGALYPSVGVDVASVWLADLEIMSAVAGTVQRGLGRAGLNAVGEQLDGRPAALITACTRDVERTVEEHLSASRSVLVRHVMVDVSAMERLCSRAVRSRPQRSDHSTK